MNFIGHVKIVSQQKCSTSLQSNVTHNVAANSQIANTKGSSVVLLGPIVLFSQTKFTTTSNKHLEKIENLHVASLMHKLLSSSAGTTDLLYGFENKDGRKRAYLTINMEALQKEFLKVE